MVQRDKLVQQRGLLGQTVFLTNRTSLLLALVSDAYFQNVNCPFASLLAFLCNLLVFILLRAVQMPLSDLHQIFVSVPLTPRSFSI